MPLFDVILSFSFQLDLDQLYTTSIHNIVSTSLQLDKKQNSDTKDSETKFKFENIKGLLRSVSNPEMAIAAAKWVAKSLPTGKFKYHRTVFPRIRASVE